MFLKMKKQWGIRAVSFFCALALFFFAFSFPVSAEKTAEDTDVTKKSESTSGEKLPCASAILMDETTGQVLFEQNADAPLPPASVTKIMTLLLVMEAVDSGKIQLSDPVTVSTHAASMGGSQVYLKEGESMCVEEMIKCVVISSANDCAVALAEFVAGSESAFVDEMNRRAAELGMKNTHFENTNGLDDTAVNHVTSARDIAIMSRALLSHPTILTYSGIWMDSIRDGAFGLTNTNRLVRFYPGCTGLKTGSTAKAKFCISATAKRDGLSLICVIMAADSRDIRNQTAAALLDRGFAGYSAYSHEGESFALPVKGGVSPEVKTESAAFGAVVPKGSAGRVKVVKELPEFLEAPVMAGDEVGQLIFKLDGNEIGRTPIRACEGVEKISFGTLFFRILAKFLLS